MARLATVSHAHVLELLQAPALVAHVIGNLMGLHGVFLSYLRVSCFITVVVFSRCTNCGEGHGGDRCEYCMDGYFGDPQGILGSPTVCARCDCSGNVNESALGNCNNLTGICSQCLYNTAGDHCELCSRGYYGNALAQNCTGN